MVTFSELGIDSDIVEVLSENGITEAFPIQAETIPIALRGQDIIGQAKTGTGKTLGFGLPLLQRLGANPEPGVQALVVTPTRELAVQVHEDLKLAASKRGTTVVPIYGGKAYEEQIDRIKDGAQVIVGTPGRLLDLMNQRILTLKNVKEIVLDEADRMLDLGFLPDIERIFQAVPAVRHTMLFSATMPGPILNLARRFMSNPVHIRITDPNEGVLQSNIKHLVYRAHPLDKDEMIARILQAEGREKVVIFMRTKRAAAKLLEELKDRGFKAAAVHGDMDQSQRERSMTQFREGKKDVLIATDVAARGIDVDDVSHVINHSIPEDEKTYLHRVGRTGRAGRTGIAVTFMDWEDQTRWTLIAKALELPDSEPVETYSSSPHLFADLGIPEGTKGRLPGATTRGKDAPPKEAGEGSGERSNGSRSRSRSRSRRRSESAQPASPETQDGNESTANGDSAEAADAERAPRKRRRRRRVSGSSQGSAQRDSAASEASASEE
ncbi:DEAD/DEAH box helicase [Gulosibacter molinativorax]|uniref:RNA helicase n=1 Tax=Gulosibacter molinativorax TaxID=256821 RepID=A0ABT7C5V9_9MICO|nr:DEAD/DEAH box helicase [Gulosibacter molinativorax]MDJ1370577.1 ATP-dependent helicase [Gulosibacter molinativorax]QUY62007.1 ATP-dependent RNA helicase [Gulosibacter molinativorax]